MKIIVSAALALSVLATLATSADATFSGGNSKNASKGNETIFTDKNLP